MSEEAKPFERWRIAQILRAATDFLRENGFDIEDARRDANLLLTETLRRSRAFLITHTNDEISTADAHNFHAFIKRRAAREPLQYITGHQEFYGLDFEVTPDVLIPRPETELLVDIALELARAGEFKSDAIRICDVGAGSGCIVISILHELAARRVKAHGVGLDIAPAALRVAARNRARHNLSDGDLTFIASDCFSALDAARVRFDLIVSNPPYVAAHEVKTLQREVRDYEPLVALTPNPNNTDMDDDGLSIVRRLLADAPAFLSERGFLTFEIGFSQRAKVENLIDANIWRIREVRDDLQGVPRTFVLQRTD
jgi:release factor glutamine methyltransferase